MALDQKVTDLLLILPFSNASVERVFTTVNDIRILHILSLNNHTIVALMNTMQGISKTENLLNL